MLTFAIGDLHGRLDLFDQAVQIARATAKGESFTFVVCGDFIDRGPQSAQIIERMRELQTRNDLMSLIVLKGNHEDMMLTCLRGQHRLSWWLANGGSTTLESYGYKDGDLLQPLKIPEDHLEWLKNLPVWHLDDYRAFVHAGFDTSKSLYQQNEQHMMWMRSPRGHDYSFLNRHVVHGHEQYADGPILNPNKTNVDTFAWASGRLAIAVFDNEIPGGPIQILWATGEPHVRWLDWSRENGVD